MLSCTLLRDMVSRLRTLCSDIVSSFYSFGGSVTSRCCSCSSNKICKFSVPSGNFPGEMLYLVVNIVEALLLFCLRSLVSHPRAAENLRLYGLLQPKQLSLVLLNRRLRPFRLDSLSKSSKMTFIECEVIFQLLR